MLTKPFSTWLRVFKARSVTFVCKTITYKDIKIIDEHKTGFIILTKQSELRLVDKTNIKQITYHQ